MVWKSRIVLAAPGPLLTPPPSFSPPKTPHRSYSDRRQGPLGGTFLCVCFITAGPITKLFAWGGGRVEDMWYERRRAEACVTVDESAHHALGCGGGSIDSVKRSKTDGGLWDVSATGVGSFGYGAMRFKKSLAQSDWII